MRAATAYFAGVGTVAVAIVAGLGGGLLLGDIMSPRQPKHPSSEVARLEQQRSASQPIPAMNVASQPVPYVGATQIANTVAITVLITARVNLVHDGFFPPFRVGIGYRSGGLYFGFFIPRHTGEQEQKGEQESVITVVEIIKRQEQVLHGLFYLYS